MLITDLDDNARYRALCARDARFDGVFFVGVSSTGIYCRPVCPARRPKRANCTFFDTAAAAEAAGYRPCLRCRPERAPGRSRVDATNRLAAAAFERIRAGALNGGSVRELATSLCVGERQLRRAVKRQFGVSPVELAQTSRLLLAKQLLTETGLPVTQVAFASGFSSVTRFNALFRARYRLSPSGLRREAGGNGAGSAGDAVGATMVRLDYRPPLGWRRLLRFLAARATPGVESVVDGRYARTMALDGHAGWLEVRPATDGQAVNVRVSDSLAPVLMTLLARVRHLFDLDAEPDAIADALGRDPRLARTVRRVPGLRVPGAMDGFEVAVRAVLGQQVSVRGATTLAGRLAAAFGEPVPLADGRLAPVPGKDAETVASPGEARASEVPLARLPVTAERLAGAAPETVARVGIPHSRAHTIVLLARAVADAELDLGPTADPDATVSALQEIRGIGPWTAQYVAMRALHWPDAFPAGDLGIRRALDGHDAAAVAEAWRPWRAYAAMYLWEGLDTNGDEET